METHGKLRSSCGRIFEPPHSRTGRDIPENCLALKMYSDGPHALYSEGLSLHDFVWMQSIRAWYAIWISKVISNSRPDHILHHLKCRLGRYCSAMTQESLNNAAAASSNPAPVGILAFSPPLSGKDVQQPAAGRGFQPSFLHPYHWQRSYKWKIVKLGVKQAA